MLSLCHSRCEPLERQLIKPGTASTDAECGEKSSDTKTVVGAVGAVVGIVFLSCGAAAFVVFVRKKKRKDGII